MRQDHRAGEKLFVDYTGQRVEIADSTTGEIREAQVFVAVLGASNYTYAEATWTQALPDWIGSHVRAFTFFGGVTKVVECEDGDIRDLLTYCYRDHKQGHGMKIPHRRFGRTSQYNDQGNREEGHLSR